MHAPILVSVLGVVCLVVAWGEPPQDLVQAVADLSADAFAERERATRILWESGDEAMVADIVRHGATTEARARAAQVLSSYHWGIVPGVSEAVREQLELFPNGSLATRAYVLSALMRMGEMRAAARCVRRIDAAVERRRLEEVLRARLGETVPRELARGQREEVQRFLESMAVAAPEYGRDLDALQSGEIADEDFARQIVAATPTDEPRWRQAAPAGLLFANLTDHALTLLRGKRRHEAAVFDILHCQGRIADAVEALRSAIGAAASTSASDVLHAYLAREAAKVKPQLYSKKALNLPHTAAYQPTGIKFTDGLRHVIAFCHAYDLTQPIEATGAALASLLEAESPAALPAFCAWAAHYPELRSRAITAATTASRAGVPAEFAFGPLADQLSRQGAWFGQFTTLRERRSLLESGARNGGWSGLSDVASALLPAAVRGQSAMAAGDWEAAADACAEAAENANTLANGAVQAFLASVAHAHAGHPEMAAQWRAIAEAIPLSNASARAALADAMHHFGEIKGARRNRMLVLYQHRWQGDSTAAESAAFLHVLRLSCRSAGLTSDPVAGSLARPLFRALAREIAATPESLTGLGDIVRDSAFFYQSKMVASIAAERWNEVRVHLRAAHRCAPGDLRPFEIIAEHVDRLDPDCIGTARQLLIKATRLWQEAVVSLPDNARCARQLQGCLTLQGKLTP